MPGAHTGKNLADLFIDTIENYGGLKNLCAITTDNASSNKTMAKAIETASGGTFKADKQLMGCVAHVLNLAAVAGLKVLGPRDISSENDQTDNPMAINALVDTPDGAHVDMALVYKRIHGISNYTRASPQRLESFQNFIRLFPTPNLPPTAAQSLILDVRTRWNSTYAMLERALVLRYAKPLFYLQFTAWSRLRFDVYRSACDQFCTAKEGGKFKLSPIEWKQLELMMNFLKPLNDATERLCATTYPTLNIVIPIYVVVINKLQSVCFF